MSEQFKGPGRISSQPPTPGGPIGHVPVGSLPSGPGTNEKVLFWASFLTLIAAGMGFSIRGDLLDVWGREFGFTQTQLGEITGMGLVGFGVTIIGFSFIADWIGYGRLMIIAFLLHVTAAVGTLAAPFLFDRYRDDPEMAKSAAFWCLYLSQLAFSLGNGTCEAVINPLTAKLFPNNKTHYLNILHAGWPGGLVLGPLVVMACDRLGVVGWQIKWGIILLPMVIYGVMMIGRRFPRSEAREAGIPMGTMVVTLFAPILLFLFLLHALIGYVELGTDSWIINITKIVLEDQNKALYAFIWTNVLMFTLRFFAGPIVHQISPIGLLFGSAVLGSTGLWMLGQGFSNSTWMWMLAVTVYGIGKTFYWPTMLGVISECYPRGGALALGISGGIGMISAGLLGGPGIGYKQDYAASHFLQDKAPPTFTRYRAKEEESPYPFLPRVAGLDNAKVGVLDDNGKKLAEELESKPDDKSLLELADWWNEAKEMKDRDKVPVREARLYGGKTALEWTAAVPAVMAVGYLILIFYFLAKGGYKAEVLVGHAAKDEEFTGGTEGPGEG